MTARKVAWVKGDKRQETWAATFYDADGNRHRKQGFTSKKLALEWEREESERIKQQALAPKLKAENLTIANLCQEWLDSTSKGLGERHAIEHTSWKDYELSVRLHINPRIGKKPLAGLSAPDIAAFRKTLLEEVSRDKAQRVLKHLRQAFNFGVEQGYLLANPAATIRIAKSTREHQQVSIPSRQEMARLLTKLDEKAQRELDRPELKQRPWTRFAAMFVLLQGGGLRISEARGLAWDAVDLDRALITIRQRADRSGQIGPVKSKAGYRTVVVGELVVSWLKRWKPFCPPSPHNLVFPTRTGLPEAYANIYADSWKPLCVECGLVDKDGKALYGLHDARHFRVSEKIAIGANVREIMGEIGHASSAMTLDLYGHLFPEDLEKRREEARQIEAKIWAENGQKIDQQTEIT